MKQKIPYIAGLAACLAALILLLSKFNPMPAWMSAFEARLGVLVGSIIAGYCSFHFTSYADKENGKINMSLVWWAGCWIALAQLMVTFYILDK